MHAPARSSAGRRCRTRCARSCASRSSRRCRPQTRGPAEIWKQVWEHVCLSLFIIIFPYCNMGTNTMTCGVGAHICLGVEFVIPYDSKHGVIAPMPSTNTRTLGSGNEHGNMRIIMFPYCNMETNRRTCWAETKYYVSIFKIRKQTRGPASMQNK